MRSPVRERQKIWFSNISEEKDSMDTIHKYGALFSDRLTVSAGTGMPGQISAGLVVDYDREITSYDKSLRLKIKEGDVCWIDVEPLMNCNKELIMTEDGVTPITPPDYRITQIFSTLKGNVDVFGIKKIGGNQ